MVVGVGEVFEHVGRAFPNLTHERILELLADGVLLVAIQRAQAGDLPAICRRPGPTRSVPSGWPADRPQAGESLPSGVMANFNSTSLKSPCEGRLSRFRFALMKPAVVLSIQPLPLFSQLATRWPGRKSGSGCRD